MEQTSTTNTNTSAADTQNILDVIITEGLFFLSLVIIIFFSTKLINGIIDKYFARIYKSSQAKGRNINQKRIKTLAGAFKSISSVTIWTIAVFVVMGHFGVNTSALLTGAGAVGIFFSIAGRDVIMDLYVGLTALIEDQYRVGDDIIVNKEHIGTVEEITLRTVKLRDTEGNVHIVPHSMARSIINKTYDYSIVNLDISVKNGSDMDKVKELVDYTGHELAKDSHWSRSFVEPIKYLTMQKYDKSELTFTVIGKVKPGKQNSAISEFKIRINDTFEKEGIKQIKISKPENSPSE